MNKKYERYSMLIHWSEPANVYIVTVPELAGGKTHGSTYEEAVQHRREAIELWITASEEWGDPIPEPKVLLSLEESA